MRSLPSAVIKTTSITLLPSTSLTSTVNALKNDGQKCDKERGRKCVEGLAADRLGADHIGSVSTVARLSNTCGGSAIRVTH